jgi:histone-lysine N-methyltransferase SETMAR
MNFQKTQFRHSLLFQYKQGHTAAQSHRVSRAVLGNKSLHESSSRRWFAKFKSGDESLKDKQRPGRPSKFDQQPLLQLLESNSRLSTRDMARELQACHMTIYRHLLKLGFEQKYGQWIPHDLTDDQKKKRKKTCEDLLALRADKEWLKQLVTGDEKWVLYVNHTRKKQWLPSGQEPEPDPKAPLHPKKVMLCVFWDYKGVIWYELLPYGKTITARVYSHQLHQMAQSLQEKRPMRSKTYFLHDNAKPHTANLTKKKLKALKWEVLPHAPYSPDLAPTDYHLFRSLQHFLREKKFDDFASVKSAIESFFVSRSPDFYSDGIFKLPGRWSQVVESGGEYIKN